MSDARRLYQRSLDFLDGRGVEQNDDRAFELNAEAAASGHHDAVLAMGWFHLNGVGVEPDIETARHWYRQSARQGDPRAMFSLGQVALMERRAQEAVTWFRRAADHGHVRSLYWIAKLLWRGDGGNKDRAEAQRLLQRAAEKGDREARRALRFLSWLRKRGAREP